MKQLRSSPSRRHNLSKENTPPYVNSLSPSPSIPGQPFASDIPVKMKSPLPPRPPNSHKRKLLDVVPETSVPGSDSGVQVVVRIRPPNKEEGEEEMVVKQMSSDSLSINGHTFTFDSIANTEATQLDIFQLVGTPLVENCLAGFNSSVFAYGQTGSGKTYTMWGPANALLEENLSNDLQGLTPRVFERLFSRINEEQIKHADQQIKYQCRCSFLEIYNEQITDLLDPSQKSLQIREDVKSGGVYVENLKESCVSTMKDVTQLLMKGLSNRRTGATTVNAESSRSHSVFTCVLESQWKSASDGVSSFRTSRINLVDLAGSERQKSTGTSGDRLKEAGNINRSLSQLGNLINILAEVSKTGKQRHIPYRDSRLTFLLQESLGGNAKLAMVCAVSPFQSCKSETLSTLRFAQRTKDIKNKAVVNEVIQDDVNVLREVIRGLKEELLRMKANENLTDSNGGYSNGWNARRSLNLLRFSLNRPMSNTSVDDNGDTEMEIAVEEGNQLLQLETEAISSIEATVEETEPNSARKEPINKSLHDTDLTIQESQPNHESMIIESEKSLTHDPDFSKYNIESYAVDNQTCPLSLSLSIVPAGIIQCVSPKMSNNRKSIRTSTAMTANSIKSSASNALAIQTSENFHTPTQHLAASINRGLEMIENHRQSLALRKSSFRFSPKPADYIPKMVAEKVNVGVQTLPQENEMIDDDLLVVLCSNCKTKTSLREANESSNLQIVPVDGSGSTDTLKNLVPKAVEKVLAGAIRREMALEEICSKQTTEINQLNRLIHHYKHERECNSIIGHTREDKILRLECLMDGVLPTDEFMEKEFLALTNEHNLLKEKYENHPEVLKTKIELQRVQDELESYKNFHDMGERDVLLEELQDFRTQLQYYTDSSSISARKRNSLLKLTNFSEPNSHQPSCSVSNSNNDFEQEKLRWTKSESKWISLAEELRSELDHNRSLLTKQNQELDSEKKCAEELKEAMQMAMQGHARMLEQYADLQENHFALLARHRKIQEGIVGVKKAAAKAGVKNAESKYINALAAEISALKVQREKEKRFFRDENKMLQSQLQDTAEAVQAAGELLVRLKEAEEAVTAAQNRAVAAEQETKRLYIQIKKLKHKHVDEPISEYDTPIESIQFSNEESDTTKYDHDWKKESGPIFDHDGRNVSKLTEPSSWFSGYDRCNI